MRLRDDERAQSVQIGAVLLFAVLVLSFTTYQAAVVPDQNRAVEISHSERVQGQLQELRNALVSTVGGGSQRSTAVDLGTRYPSRAVAVNPAPPAGTLRTAGTGDARVNVSVRNAVAGGEARDVWNGTARVYPTGGIVYDPGYNVYQSAPRTVYEQTVLYNDYGDARIGLANQTMIEGETISLVALDGSLSRTTAGTASVDVRPISASQRTVAVADDGDPITVAFATRLPAAEWERRLAGQEHVADVRERPDAAPDPYRLVEVVLERGVTYRLQLTKVGVGTGATGENATYLVDRTGGATVRQGETVDVAVAARDDYGNPVQGTTVNGSVGTGSLSPSTATSGEDGRVAFEYDASGVEPGTYRVNVSLGRVGSGFDGGTGENATVEVTVTEPSGSGDGSYALDWRDPAGTDGNGGAALSDCSAESCVWDVGASDGDTLALAAALDPPFEGVDVEYAVDNSTVGTVSPASNTTGSDGAAGTTLAARENGTVDVLASTNEDGDVITVAVENVSSDPAVQSRVADLSHRNEDLTRYNASFEVHGAGNEHARTAVAFRNRDTGTTTWSNDTSSRGTQSITASGTTGDSYEVEVIALNDAGDRIASRTIVDDAADGRSPAESDDLGDASSPQITGFDVVDRSSPSNGAEYEVTYESESTEFGRVQLHLVSLDRNSGGRDVATLSATSSSETLSAYGHGSEFRVVLLLYDDEGAIVDTAVETDPADGTDP